MITTEMFTFLSELRENNAKSWFDENRTRYEQLVRDPFKEFCATIIARLHQIHPGLPGLSAAKLATIPDNPSDGIMRINRDMRFSREKAPYHTYLRAAFTPDGRKSGNAGLYLTVEPDLVGAGGGIYRAPRAVAPGLPRLDGVALDAEYREQIDAIHERGLKKNDPVIAIVSVSPQEFLRIDDQVGWLMERFAEVSPLVGALQGE